MHYAPPMTPYLEILHTSKAFIIANKQSGLLTVPGRGEEKQDCLFSRVLTTYDDVLVVHRLDMATSGLVIFARSKEVQGYFGRLFQERQISKTYHAIVEGVPSQQNGVIDYPLSPDWPNRPKQKIDLENGKKAETNWFLLKTNNGKSLIKLLPKTGRSHQLRVHMAEFGYPILGDKLYATDSAIKAATRLMLHASKLEFLHPLDGQSVAFTSPPPFCDQV